MSESEWEIKTLYPAHLLLGGGPVERQSSQFSLIAPSVFRVHELRVMAKQMENTNSWNEFSPLQSVFGYSFQGQIISTDIWEELHVERNQLKMVAHKLDLIKSAELTDGISHFKWESVESHVNQTAGADSTPT